MKKYKYEATIHTLEVELILPAEWGNNERWTWWDGLYELNLPCIDKRWYNNRYGVYHMIVNPHKLYRAEDGRFEFKYRSLRNILKDMDTIKNDICIDDFIIKRMDICIDAAWERRYEYTNKLTRLIMLMLADQIGNMNNRYLSDDPLTLDPKSITMMNGTKNTATLSMEHYNRRLHDQTDWANTPVTNRFELRAMREQAGRSHTAEDILNNWIGRFEKLTEDHLQRVTDTINKGIFDRWMDYEIPQERLGTSLWNAFLFGQADHLYTRKQLQALFELNQYWNYWMPGGTAGVRNFLDKKRFGSMVELYTFKDIQAEIGYMLDALKRFRDKH